MGDLTAHFSKSEFACPCCGLVGMDDDFMEKLEEARVRSKIGYHINSGRRCHNHNEAVGGSPTSSHMKGNAADISARTDYIRYRILEGLLRAGFTRIGIAKTFIHVDDDETKNAGRVWIYE